MKSCSLVACLVMALFHPGQGFAAESIYTKLDLDKDCTFYSSHEQGGGAECKGYKDYPVFFSEGDLRQTMRYGFVHRETDQWETFGEFNHIGTTIEWRLANDIPFATILRWFIENEDPEKGGVTDETRGQVLVVSTIGTNENRVSCIAGYVDARANNNANELARDVADRIAVDFHCGRNAPKFHGNRGEWSGNPTVLAN